MWHYPHCAQLLGGATTLLLSSLFAVYRYLFIIITLFYPLVFRVIEMTRSSTYYPNPVADSTRRPRLHLSFDIDGLDPGVLGPAAQSRGQPNNERRHLRRLGELVFCADVV